MRAGRCADGVRAALRRLIIGWVYPDPTHAVTTSWPWSFHATSNPVRYTLQPDQHTNAHRGERLHMGLTMDKYDLTNNDSMLLSQLMQRVLDDKRCA